MLARAGQRGRVPSYAGSERARRTSERAGQRTRAAHSAQISQRRAAGNRPAQTIPGIGQPVLHCGHPSPPDPVQAVAPGCLAFFPDAPAGTPVTGKRAQPPAHHTDRLPGRGRRDCLPVTRRAAARRGEAGPHRSRRSRHWPFPVLRCPAATGSAPTPGQRPAGADLPRPGAAVVPAGRAAPHPGQPSRACTPATTGPSRSACPAQSLPPDSDPPGTGHSGWSQPQHVCCVSPGENLGGRLSSPAHGGSGSARGYTTIL
jgi:hypothetical protein